MIGAGPRSVGKMLAESFGIDRGRRDDQVQIRATRERLLEVSQQEINVQRSFVGLVQDNDFVLIQEAITLRLGQQNAVGHQLDQRIAIGLVLKANLEADLPAQRHAQLLGQPGPNAAGGDPPRLRVPDDPQPAQTGRQTDFGQLRRFARAGFPGHDQRLMLPQRPFNLLTMIQNRQRQDQNGSLESGPRAALAGTAPAATRLQAVRIAAETRVVHASALPVQTPPLPAQPRAVDAEDFLDSFVPAFPACP